MRAGELSGELLDERVRTVLELAQRGSHVLDLDESFDVDAHHALARRAAAASVVLLQNTDDALPIPDDVSVALIGEFARTPRFQGAGSSQVSPTWVENLIDELTALRADVRFAPGYHIDESDDHGDDAAGLLEDAVAAAQSADMVVMVVGLPASYESEGFDRVHMRLPSNQPAALEAVAAANPQPCGRAGERVGGRAGAVVERTLGLVEAWLGGQAAAGGIADVLVGRVNPSGRLAETIPHRLEDNPSFLNFPGDSQVVRYGEGLYVGYRGYDKQDRDVAFPFGFGLSYNTFELADLDLVVSGEADDGTLTVAVSATVTNTGTVPGAHVVQVYVRDTESSVHRPVRELKGFARVELNPGDAQRVEVDLDRRAFSFWSERYDRWVVESGEFVVEVGHHSRNLPLSQSVQIDAAPLRPPLTADSTLEEWANDPLGRQLLAEATAEGAPIRFKTPKSSGSWAPCPCRPSPASVRWHPTTRPSTASRPATENARPHLRARSRRGARSWPPARLESWHRQEVGHERFEGLAHHRGRPRDGGGVHVGRSRCGPCRDRHGPSTGRSCRCSRLLGSLAGGNS